MSTSNPISFRSSRRPLGKSLYLLAVAHAVTVLLVVGVGSAIASDVQSPIIDFSHQPIGAPPQNFEFWRAAGEADAEHWKVVREASADGGVSIQESGANRAADPSLAIYVPVSAVDGKVRVRFKLIDGSRPSAGIALRITSPNDYYLVRASAYEQRVTLLHVVDGTAEEIAGVDADIAQDRWQTLEVVSRGDGFSISLNDNWVLTGFDCGKLVAGRFGIWAERDDVARFDQIEIASLT
jgi:hypothetical protein